MKKSIFGGCRPAECRDDGLDRRMVVRTCAIPSIPRLLRLVFCDCGNVKNPVRTGGECVQIQPFAGQPRRIGSHLNRFTRNMPVHYNSKAHIPSCTFCRFQYPKLTSISYVLRASRNFQKYSANYGYAWDEDVMPSPTGQAMAECG